jgi:hypothetical protein
MSDSRPGSIAAQPVKNAEMMAKAMMMANERIGGNISVAKPMVRRRSA